MEPRGFQVEVRFKVVAANGRLVRYFHSRNNADFEANRLRHTPEWARLGTIHVVQVVK
jgi:hypothetical protein